MNAVTSVSGLIGSIGAIPGMDTTSLGNAADGSSFVTDLGSIGGYAGTDLSVGGSAANGTSFVSELGKALQSVNSAQNNAAGLATAFALHQTNDIHNVMIAAQQASLALQLTTQVRNKVVEAYQEVMRMSM